MSAKQTKIRELLKENQHLKEQNKGLVRKVEMLMANGDHRLVEIDNVLSVVENTFSSAITWNKLSSEPDRQLKILERSIKRIRDIAREDNEPTKVRTPKGTRDLFA